MNHSIAGVDALLFDLGGVLIEVDFMQAFEIWSRHCGVPAALLHARFAADSFYEQHERGEIDAATYFASLRRTLDISLSDDQFEQGWNAILGAEIHSTTLLLEQLRRTIPLYVFSNSNLTHQRQWTTQFAPMLGHFERIFVSSDIGKRKPEPAAFAHISQEIGVPLARILFFDDTEENVEAARQVGMQAIHVTCADSVRNAIAALR